MCWRLLKSARETIISRVGSFSDARKRGNALSKLESVLSKEQELDSIGHQAAAAAHSLGTPLSTITVIARELKKEVSKSTHFYDDIDTLLNQARKCGEILKKLSKREIISDDYMTYTSIQDLLNKGYYFLTFCHHHYNHLLN